MPKLSRVGPGSALAPLGWWGNCPWPGGSRRWSVWRRPCTTKHPAQVDLDHLVVVQEDKSRCKAQQCARGSAGVWPAKAVDRKGNEGRPNLKPSSIYIYISPYLMVKSPFWWLNHHFWWWNHHSLDQDMAIFRRSSERRSKAQQSTGWTSSTKSLA